MKRREEGKREERKEWREEAEEKSRLMEGRKEDKKKVRKEGEKCKWTINIERTVQINHWKMGPQNYYSLEYYRKASLQRFLENGIWAIN